MSEQMLTELKSRLYEASDIASALNLLFWDQSTYMPPGGAAARGRTIGTLSKLWHTQFTDSAIGRLLDGLQSHGEALPYDDDDAALIRATRRQYEKETKVPGELIGRLGEHTATLYNTWTQARPTSDFSMVSDGLARTLDISREIANCYPGYEHIADPLIDEADYGMKAQSVRAIFAELRDGLIPIVRAIAAQAPADDSALKQFFAEAAQMEFGEQVIRDFGYDFERGRQDKTHHPFMVKFATGDVRITTRVNEYDFVDAFFSTIHEAGHALYEQGINPEYEGTPLSQGTSAGIHESQSRTWENIVGRSRPFWAHYYPSLQAAFPDSLGALSLDSFYRAINRVTPSLIRVDADEVTYNLHVMIRFELELALLEGSLEIRDLPEAWNARYQSDLGITPPDDRDGVLQDVHWYGGMIGGAFQGYTLGNIFAAQFYEAALRARPEIPDAIGGGNFAPLLEWSRENIHQHGSKYTAPELLERVTGGGLDVQPMLRYLREKYGALYSL